MRWIIVGCLALAALASCDDHGMGNLPAVPNDPRCPGLRPFGVCPQSKPDSACRYDQFQCHCNANDAWQCATCSGSFDMSSTCTPDDVCELHNLSPECSCTCDSTGHWQCNNSCFPETPPG